MSILIDSSTKVITQGFSGKNGAHRSQHAILASAQSRSADFAGWRVLAYTVYV